MMDRRECTDSEKFWEWASAIALFPAIVWISEQMSTATAMLVAVVMFFIVCCLAAVAGFLLVAHWLSILIGRRR